MHWKGDELIGTIEILKTPKGLTLRKLYLQGKRLGVSSRGWATLLKSKKGAIHVAEDFHLIT